MSLLEKLSTPTKLVSDEGYYLLLETHRTYFRNHPTTTIQSFSGQIAEKYKGDFFGLLNYLSMDKKIQYLIMRMNDLYSSSDFTGEQTSILVPSSTEVSKVIATYSSIES